MLIATTHTVEGKAVKRYLAQLPNSADRNPLFMRGCASFQSL
jgi:hypothetical protein